MHSGHALAARLSRLQCTQLPPLNDPRPRGDRGVAYGLSYPYLIHFCGLQPLVPVSASSVGILHTRYGMCTRQDRACCLELFASSAGAPCVTRGCRRASDRTMMWICMGGLLTVCDLPESQRYAC